jgi:hypothetical protein
VIDISFCDACGQQAPVDKYFRVCAKCEALAREEAAMAESRDLGQARADDRFYSFQEKYGHPD